MMKSYLYYLLGSVVVAAIGLGQISNDNASYEPRKLTIKEPPRPMDWAKIDLRTGEFNPNARNEVWESFRHTTSSSRAEGMDFSFENYGPDNVGGRTRAIIELYGDPDILIAGSASGGLFISYNGGANWEPHAQFQNLETSASIIGSIHQDTTNGVIYVGTGCVFEGPDWPGYGIFRSKDKGETFEHLPETTPESRYALGGGWNHVNRIRTDGNGIVYAATEGGLMRSTDQGDTWEEVMYSGLPFVGEAADVVAMKSGRVFASRASGQVYMSNTGEAGTFEQVGTTALPAGGRRTVLAASATDEDHVIILINGSNDCLVGIYETKNGGATWTKRLSDHDDFVPMYNGQWCQGHYDAALAMSPTDDNTWFIGGITLWRFDGNLTRVASEFGSPPLQDILPYYVHADKHYFYFSPNDPNRMYVTSDGGISVTQNRGESWQTLNKGYITTQFYSMAYANESIQIGGTQDNGSLVVLGNIENDPKVAYQISGGDGIGCATSKVAPLMFTSSQSGTVYRVDASQVDNINPSAISGDGGPFHTALALWESLEDLTSKDSITFEVGNQEIAVATSNGVVKTYDVTVEPVQDAAIVIRSSIEVVSGTQTLKIDPNNPLKLIGSGGSFGDLTFNDDGTFDVLINFGAAPPENSNIYVRFEERFNANSVINVESENLRSGTVTYAFEYRLESDLNPGDVIKIQDPVQSWLASTGGPTGTGAGGIRLYRNILKFDTIALAIDLDDLSDQTHFNPIKPTVQGSVTALAFTKDGNHLFVGNSNGTIYRVSGLQNLYYSSDRTELNAMLGQLTITSIGSGFGSGGVTDICLDPSDNNKMLICGGGYGSPDRVKYTESALGAMTFTNVHGDLPPFPIYSCQIDQFKPNIALLGTEFGLWATDNLSASAGATTWNDVNSELSYVPVYALDQQPMPEWSGNEETGTGLYFVGSYGRGFWRSTKLVGIGEVDPLLSTDAELSGLRVYPNPVKNDAQIAFTSSVNGNAIVSIYDLQGRQVKTWKETIVKGSNNVEISATGLRSGNYIATIEAGNSREMAKFIVLK